MGMDSEGIFKCGVIVAPVTDWKFYHSIYTERYMNTPKDNEGGYNKSSAIREDAVKNFQLHDQVYMIHGTADDNVHFQNSADLSRFMIQQGVDSLELVSFQADENHGFGLTNKGYDRHYKVMTRIAEDCLGLEEIEADNDEEESKKIERSNDDYDLVEPDFLHTYNRQARKAGV